MSCQLDWDVTLSSLCMLFCCQMLNNAYKHLIHTLMNIFNIITNQHVCPLQRDNKSLHFESFLFNVCLKFVSLVSASSLAFGSRDSVLYKMNNSIPYCKTPKRLYQSMTGTQVKCFQSPVKINNGPVSRNVDSVHFMSINTVKAWYSTNPTSLVDRGSRGGAVRQATTDQRWSTNSQSRFLLIFVQQMHLFRHGTIFLWSFNTL